MIHTEKELIAIQIEEMGDQHVMTTIETPMREDAFLLSDEEKIAQIEDKFRDIMNIMGLDLTDDSLQGTPHRVAKMYVKEIFSGLNPENKPAVKLFENKYQYKEMLVFVFEIESHCSVLRETSTSARALDHSNCRRIKARDGN